MDHPVFDDEDKVILANTLRLRTRMLDVFARKDDKDLPTKPSEMLAIAQLAGSIDKTVIDRAKLRADQQNAQSLEKDRAVLLDLMMHMHQTPKKTIVADDVVDTTAMPEYISNTSKGVSDGELIRREDTMDISELT